MVKQFGLRPFHRMHDGILIHITLDEWPADVPLPEGIKLLETDDGVVHPFWRIVLEPNRTIEAIGGMFRMNCSLDATSKKFEHVMQNVGWKSNGMLFQEERRTTFRYTHSVEDAYVEVSLLQSKDLETTRVTIRRVVKHPYAPPIAEEESVEENVEPALEEVAK